MNYKKIMDTTDNSLVYKRARRGTLWKTARLCRYCPMKGGENAGYWSKGKDRNWKRFRKKQYKVKDI